MTNLGANITRLLKLATKQYITLAVGDRGISGPDGRSRSQNDGENNVEREIW